VALAILLALLAEKLFLVLPVLPLHPGILLVENVLLLGVWLLAVQSAGRLLPGAVGGGQGEEGREKEDGGT
jgi:hypothetical protein